jgi:hypothetical protein
MSYSCDDDYYCDDNYNNGCCGGAGLAYLIAFYPFVPFTVVGYELLEAFGGGINGLKWAGAVLGGIIGWYFYINVGKFLAQKLHINTLLVVLLGYTFASGLFYILESFYPDNQMVKMAWNIGKAIGEWAMSAS